VSWLAKEKMVPRRLTTLTVVLLASSMLAEVAAQNSGSTSNQGAGPVGAQDSSQNAQSQSSSSQSKNQASTASNPNSIVNGPNDWVHKWLRQVDRTRTKQPHYVAPLITTHVLLVQQYRFDSYYQSANGYETEDYGSMHGLEIIPNSRMEVQIAQPPYFFHEAPNTPNGWGDLSFFFKGRILSAPEGKGGYFLGAFLGLSLPTGTAPNGMGHTVWEPMLAGAKRWGFFDWQTNLAGSLPASGISVLGRSIIFNNTFQFNALKVLWPEVENNATFYKDGPYSGKTANYLTPGVLIGPFQIAERLHFEPGFGIQIATSGFYTYNHRWIWTVRLPF
jgi:hypothetical protein